MSGLLGVTQLAVDSAWALYAVGALLVIGGATGVVLGRNPVHSALSLVTTIFGTALLFLDQGAYFLAAVQVIVYAGAIVILFLFVIMLLGVDRREQVLAETFRGQRYVALVLGCMVLAEVVLLARTRWTTGAHSVAGPLGSPGSNVGTLGRAIFTTYLVPFEVTSALLVVAVVAAVVLARRPGLDDAPGEQGDDLAAGDPPGASPGTARDAAEDRAGATTGDIATEPSGATADDPVVAR